jgi:hypothetical protein
LRYFSRLRPAARPDGPWQRVTDLNNVGNWILGAAAAALGTAGLFVSAKSGQGVGYYGGIAIFLFCSGFVMYLIKTSFDHK